MEYLREFKVHFEMDSNKATRTMDFNMEGFYDIQDMLDAMVLFIRDIEENGVLDALWEKFRV